MKILVTGATGFIGRHLVKQLKADGHEVTILARHTSHYADLAPDHVIYFDGIDAQEAGTLAAQLQEARIDGIIHLASLFLSQHKPEQIKDLVLSNIYLGTALLEAAKSAGVAWFLNTGSIWQNYEAADLTDDYNPVNLYAATKQAFMVMAKYYTETSALRFATLKLCDTYGPDDTRRKIYALFEEIGRTGQTLDMSPGEQLIDIVHVDKVVDAFVALMNRLADTTAIVRPEYVVTSGERIPLREVAARFERDHGVALHINWGGRPYREREVMHPYVGTPII